VRFSLGAGDRLALQPPLSSTLPVTRSSVALFFQQLGTAAGIATRQHLCGVYQCRPLLGLSVYNSVNFSVLVMEFTVLKRHTRVCKARSQTDD